MGDFHVERDGVCAAFSDQNSMLAHLETIIAGAGPLAVIAPREAVQVVRAIVEVLRRNRIDVVLLTDSEPEAADYVAQTLFGGAAGMVLGGGVAWGLSTLVRLGCSVPVVGWILAGALVVGAVAGAAAGFGVTRMGLRVRFVRVDTVRIELATC